MRSRRGFTLIELMIVVTIIGVLSAVAIPALMLSVRRSKSAEATVNIRRMFDGAVTAYQQDMTTRTGTSLLPEFPGTASASPPENACCGHPQDKCPANASDFDSLSWHRLQFSLDDPHYYWYSFDSSGAGQTATFTARANGNLDCDAVYSTFERIGFVDLFGGVTGGAAIYKMHPVD